MIWPFTWLMSAAEEGECILCPFRLSRGRVMLKCVHEQCMAWDVESEECKLIG